MFVGYRTYIAAALAALFGALAVLDWNVLLSDPNAGWATIAMGIVMAVFRAITSTPPGVGK